MKPKAGPLPAATKANTQEEDADIKESGFIQMLAT